jgi:hypothetical protein
MTTTATSANAIRVNPGVLYAAPLGSTEPVGLTGAWPSAWVPLGLTTDGSTDTYDRATADLVAAELFEPVATYTTSVTETIGFTLLNVTARNLQMAFNGGLSVPAASGGYVTVNEVDPNEEVRIMLGWDAVDSKERTVWRQCIQTGSVALARQKAPNATTIPCSFRAEQPAAGGDRRVRYMAAELAS